MWVIDFAFSMVQNERVWLAWYRFIPDVFTSSLLHTGTFRLWGLMGSKKVADDERCPVTKKKLILQLKNEKLQLKR